MTTPIQFRRPIIFSRCLYFLQPLVNISLMIDEKVLNLYSGSEIRRRMVQRSQPRRAFNSSRFYFASILVTYIRSFLCMGSLYFNGIPSMWMFGYTSGSYLLRLLPIQTQNIFVSSIQMYEVVSSCGTLMMIGIGYYKNISWGRHLGEEILGQIK